MYIKYCTNRLFDNVGFAAELNFFGVQAVAIENGLLLDYDAFNALTLGNMSHWMYVNKKHISSPYCTFPVSRQEFQEALKA